MTIEDMGKICIFIAIKGIKVMRWVHLEQQPPLLFKLKSRDL